MVQRRHYRHQHTARYYPAHHDPAADRKAPPCAAPAARVLAERVADEAMAIRGHYRLFAYTNALEALGRTAPSGWAAGSVGTSCSSFIWAAARRAGVALEAPLSEPGERRW